MDNEFKNSIFAEELLKEVPAEKLTPHLLKLYIAQREYMIQQDKKIVEIERKIDRVDRRTGEMYEHYDNIKGFSKTAQTAGKIFKWVCTIVAGAISAYAAWKGLGE